MLLAGEWEKGIWFWKGHSGCQDSRPRAQGGSWHQGTGRGLCLNGKAVGLERRDDISSERG